MAAQDTIVLYSPVISAELWHGVRDNERAAVETWFKALTCVPIDMTIGIKQETTCDVFTVVTPSSWVMR